MEERGGGAGEGVGDLLGSFLANFGDKIASRGPSWDQDGLTCGQGGPFGDQKGA